MPDTQAAISRTIEDWQLFDSVFRTPRPETRDGKEKKKVSTVWVHEKLGAIAAHPASTEKPLLINRLTS